MSEFRRPFGPHELPDESESSADLSRALSTGRSLEGFAARDHVQPSPDFADRVMGAIATEPVPTPVVAAGRALGAGRIAAFVGALGDAWRVAFSGGRPLAVRAQALAVVAVVVIAFGSIGGVAAVGALGLLSDDPSPSVSPSADPSPSVVPSPSPSATPAPSPSPSATPSPSASPTATPDDTVEPTGTASPTGTDDDDDDRTPDPTKTPDPDDTPDPTDAD